MHTAGIGRTHDFVRAAIHTPLVQTFAAVTTARAMLVGDQPFPEHSPGRGGGLVGRRRAAESHAWRLTFLLAVNRRAPC